MYKRIDIITLFVGTITLLFALTSFSQEASNLPKLDELRAPENPAYVTLGIAPSEVIKPTSAKAFAISVFENGIDEDGGLMSDFAIQFSPYWWTTRSTLTWNKYNGYDSKGNYSIPHIFDVIPQSLSFSLATSEVTVSNQSTAGTQVEDTKLLSASVSFDIFRGKPSNKLLKSKRILQEFLADSSEYENELIREFVTTRTLEAQQLFPSENNLFIADWYGECQNSQTAICQDFMDRLKNPQDSPKYQELLKSFNNNSNERVGHRLQFISALVYQLPENDFDKKDLSKKSYWLSYSYVRDKGEEMGASEFKFVGLLRYNQIDDSLRSLLTDVDLDDDSFDVGGRIIWESKRYQISASLEYVHRDSDNSDMDNERFTALIDYTLNENACIVVSIGKNLESNLVPLLSGEDTIVNVGFKLNTSALTGGLIE